MILQKIEEIEAFRSLAMPKGDGLGFVSKETYKKAVDVLGRTMPTSFVSYGGTLRTRWADHARGNRWIPC